MRIETLEHNIEKENKSVAKQKSEDYIELDIDSLIKIGVVERDINIGGTIFTMRTLTEGERMEIQSKLPKEGDEIEKIMALKIPYILKSISKINGKVISEDKKQLLEKKLLEMQSALVDQLFIEYGKLVSDQRQLLEEGVKKNSQ